MVNLVTQISDYRLCMIKHFLVEIKNLIIIIATKIKEIKFFIKFKKTK